MHAILVHGMGRSPLSMAWLGLRLRLAGHRVHFFSYCVSREHFYPCVARLQNFIQSRAHGQAYIAVGHSLGTVLLRTALAEMTDMPQATFLLAPPAQACAMARHFRNWKLYRLVTGEMGQLLADAAFMQSLPKPPAHSQVFAGTAGPQSRYLPYGTGHNDGILSVDETRFIGFDTQLLRTLHTVIMNHPAVMRAICAVRSEAV